MATPKWAQIIEYRIYYKPKYKPTINILTRETDWINIPIDTENQFLSLLSVLNGKGITFYDTVSGLLLTGQGAHPSNVVTTPPLISNKK